MKKLVLLVLTAFAVTANAQFYIGGQLGFWATKRADTKLDFQYSVLPDVGYNINSKWAVGTTIGVSDSNESFGIDDETFVARIGSFSVSPYVRFTFVNWGLVSLFVEGGGGYRYIFKSKSVSIYPYLDFFGKHQFNVGISPGVAVNLSKKFTLMAHIGFLGWEYYGADYSTFGLLFNSSTLTFGAYYNF